MITVGQLRKAIRGLHKDTEVIAQIWLDDDPEDWDGTFDGVHADCPPDGKTRLYLTVSEEHKNERPWAGDDQ